MPSSSMENGLGQPGNGLTLTVTGAKARLEMTSSGTQGMSDFAIGQDGAVNRWWTTTSPSSGMGTGCRSREGSRLRPVLVHASMCRSAFPGSVLVCQEKDDC